MIDTAPVSSAGIGIAVVPRTLSELDDRAASVVVTAVQQTRALRDVGIGLPFVASMFTVVPVLFDGASIAPLLTAMTSLLLSFPVVQLIARARVRAALVAVGADPQRHRDVDVRLHGHNPWTDFDGAVLALRGRAP